MGVLDTVMVDTVARDPLMLNQKLKLMLMPGTDVDTEDTVLAVMVDTVMADTVARDPLMPGTDVVMDMAVMVDTAVDMAVMEVTVMEVTDGASKYLTTPKKHRYKNMPFLLPKRVNTFYKN